MREQHTFISPEVLEDEKLLAEIVQHVRARSADEWKVPFQAVFAVVTPDPDDPLHEVIITWTKL